MAVLKRKKADGTWEYVQSVGQKVLTSEDLQKLRSDMETALGNHSQDQKAHGIGDKTLLETSEKASIVGAINELFINVSDGKALIGRAITDVDGDVIVPTDPSFLELANAIGEISTGRKIEVGTVTAPNVSSPTISVRGLSFKPTAVFIYHKNPSHNYHSYYLGGMFDRSSEFNLFDIPIFNDFMSRFYVAKNSNQDAGRAYEALTSNHVFYDDGFDMRTETTSTYYSGGQFGYIAIG